MSHHDLDIDLRLGFMRQAQARRPRLPGNLKQLGAVGPVVRPMAAHTRPAVVKVGITGGGTTGKHVSYLHAHKGIGREDAPLYGPAVAHKPQFVRDAQQDPHQFRLVVSVPSHPGLDRTRYIERFMQQVEKDLGRPIDWLAANHYDTEHPHTHIVLRGRDTTGKDLYVDKDYMTYGLRARASQLLTWILGPQRQQEQQVQQQVRQVTNGVTHSVQDPDTAQRQRYAMQPVAGDAQRWNILDRQRRYPDGSAFLQGVSLPQRMAEREVQRLNTGDIQRPQTPRVEAPRPGPDLTAGLERLRQALQRQQGGQEQERQRSRGQGMGW